ncbi:hypothetical protein VXO80_09655 [Acinetobacter towneri]|uniref:hypothetical protein n=2 Tax=Acinetobacter towneri TaxID=202956 RepID=UPI003A85A766
MPLSKRRKKPQPNKQTSSHPRLTPQAFAKALAKYEILRNSTRRIFHILEEYSENQNEHFKDQMFTGMGTGILLKQGLNYFLLTTRHTLLDYIDNHENSNTSPFWVTSRANHSFKSINDFLYPKYFVEIADLIEEHEYYDFKDVILVELFNPMPGQEINFWIDVDKTATLEINDFKEGILLFDNGFTEKSNEIFYDSENATMSFNPDIHSCSTIVNRDVIKGVMTKDTYTHVFKKLSYLSENTNGMSGGLIVGFHRGKVKCVGMHIRGSEDSDNINFLPISEIFKAVKRHEEAKRIIIDYCHQERVESGENLIGFDDLFIIWAKNMNLQLDELTPKQIFEQRIVFVKDNLETFVADMKDRDRILNKNI